MNAYEARIAELEEVVEFAGKVFKLLDSAKVQRKPTGNPRTVEYLGPDQIAERLIQERDAATSELADWHKKPLVMELTRATSELAAARELYSDLVDALCSPAWLPRSKPESVLALAKRMKERELNIVPLHASTCTRIKGHDGPCNGFPREDCAARAAATEGKSD